MRYTYRYKNNFDYWNDRWKDLQVDNVMKNKKIYPLKNSLKVVGDDRVNKILEAGCGNGRILRYFHNNNFDIVGIDFISSAIEKLKKTDATLKVYTDSILKTNFPDNYFQYVLAFGLYHNFKDEVNVALNETHRILNSGGKLCASFRADNIQNRILDFLYEISYKGDKKGEKSFHKSNFKIKDLEDIFENSGFKILNISKEYNMSFLFKLKFFRANQNFNENKSRSEGYKLNFFGNIIKRLLYLISPTQFCSLYVLTALKK